MKSKKATIVMVLLLLERESEEGKCLTQSRMAEIINPFVPCDRKTIGRDIKALREFGYPIKRTAKGYFMENKTYTGDEIRFVTQCIESYEGEDVDKADLINRVKDTLGRAYTPFGGKK
ncbi:MAG: HTH domain-containing protein [Clostridia bacterium]|nr:HTH domain-containing protein [Clostridia bacterium]